jgi:hypothetical protein
VLEANGIENLETLAARAQGFWNFKGSNFGYVSVSAPYPLGGQLRDTLVSRNK